MKIVVKETRKSDALKCLEKYLNDCISIINVGGFPGDKNW